MYPVVLSMHVLLCFLLILIVLLQSGKGAGFSGLMGGGNSDALFNAPSGSMFMRKVTTGLVAGFFLTSLLLTYITAKQNVATVTQPMGMPYGAPPAEAVPAAAPAPAPDAAPKPAAPAAAEAAPKKK